MYLQWVQSLDAGDPERVQVHSGWFGLVGFLALHIPLALLMYQSRPVATLHALATLAIGLSVAVSSRKPERVACVGAYIAGAEVLWRMTGAQVFWEYGKYATVAIFLVALLAGRRARVPALPLLYFALLLPSVTETLSALDPLEARGQISFNLSGPFALMVSAWFFSRLPLSRDQRQRVFLSLIAPALGIAAIALAATLTASSIQFTDESNRITSGGFGPNQVSAVLGLAALLALLIALDQASHRGLRTLMIACAVLFAAQSALTFSRGGLYAAGGAAALGCLYLARDRRSRVRLVVLGALLFVVGNYVLLPWLDAFTEGALVTRFQDLDTTHRGQLADADLQMWAEHPVLGVGPGIARLYRAAAAHTEFSRLLAEHGSLGLGSLLLLVAMGVRSLRRARAPQEKAVVAALLGWSVLFMLVNAMRLVAPAFAFGLAQALADPHRSTVTSRRRTPRRVVLPAAGARPGA